MTDPSTIDAVEFYWRPGCPFCSMLERSLDRAGLPLRKHNIWDDPADAAFVRSGAGGNETVPTVRIGPESMVNPAPAEVVEALRRHAPHLLPNAG